MYQTFVILLRAGPQNNTRLKPSRSAKKVADPWNTAHFKNNTEQLMNAVDKVCVAIFAVSVHICLASGIGVRRGFSKQMF